MTVAGRRSRTKPGPDGAPRTDSLDPRWGEDWQYIVSLHPDLRSYLLRVVRDAWDAGHRAHHDDDNPFWLDPDIAGHDDTPSAPQPLLGATVDKISPYLKAIAAAVTAFGGSYATAYASDNVVTQAEWIGIAVATVVATAAVFGIPNKDPKGVHQQESVQPKGV
jgi:hypothetical protein